MLRHGLRWLLIAAICFVAAPAPIPGPAAESTVPDLPPVASGPLPTQDELAHLAQTDPVAMFAACRARFEEQVRTYTATMVKQERVFGVLHPEETVKIAVRVEPYAVTMIWTAGARQVKVGGFNLGKIEGAIYAVGENNGHTLVWRPDSWPATMSVSPTSDQARASSRYCIVEGAILHATERSYRAWLDAKERGKLNWRYVGTMNAPEIGGRRCHVVERTADPDELDRFVKTDPAPDPKSRPQDTMHTVRVFIDAENWLQVGSVLKRKDGELIGSYFFRDVVLNPTLPADQFKSKAFKK